MSDKFHVRLAGTSNFDVDAIIGSMDSTLPYLAVMGNGEMWGTTPFSQREGCRDSIREDLDKANAFQRTGQGKAKFTFLAEVKDDSEHAGLARRVDGESVSWLPVGCMELWENNMAGHLADMKELKDTYDAAAASGGYVYISLLVADFRAGSSSKGAGAALVAFAKQYALDKGLESVYVDCWMGGSPGLGRYYENLGFKPVADYTFPRPKSGGIWSGRLFKLDL